LLGPHGDEEAREPVDDFLKMRLRLLAGNAFAAAGRTVLAGFQASALTNGARFGL
jgi:hypothetical protein